MFQTEHEFSLPRGYVDPDGNMHRDGTMRLATAADEILPLKDPRVQANPAYLVVILFSRVISRLGTLEAVNPKVVEGLFSADLQYLQDFYNRINGLDGAAAKITCPNCGQQFEAPEPVPGDPRLPPGAAPPGGSVSRSARPLDVRDRDEHGAHPTPAMDPRCARVVAAAAVMRNRAFCPRCKSRA